MSRIRRSSRSLHSKVLHATLKVLALVGGWAAGSLGILQAQETDGVNSPARGSLSYETKTFERSRTGCGAGDEPCVSFAVEYPFFTAGADERILQAMNDTVRALVLEPFAGGEKSVDLQALAEDFLRGQEEVRRENSGDFVGVPWFLERRVKPLLDDGCVLSLSIEQRWYTGGAHPNGDKRLLGLDLSSGRPLLLEDLLHPRFEDRLLELAEARFREVREIPAEQPLSEAGFWFDHDAFALSNDFALTPEGLLFRYDAYEIGPYALGPTEITVTRAELGSLLRICEGSGPLTTRSSCTSFR